MPVRIDPETRIAASPQNKSAGQLLRRARTVAEMPQTEFATNLARRVGLVGLSQSALSDWELGRRQVPAAIVIAAAQVAHMQPAELFAVEANREARLDKLSRELEQVVGALTPKQREKLRKVSGARN